MTRIRGWMAALLALTLLVVAAPALAADPTFPPLTGRVVDGANLLAVSTENDLTAKLEALEAKTGRQLVVVTVPSLQGLEIEDYGYRLGRAWGIGQAKLNNGVLLIVAPNERKVRIEVGYGLEGTLTDALSSVILQSAVLPKFKAGDMPGGVIAGTDALIAQLSLPDDEARAAVQQAEQPAAQSGGGGFPFALLPFLFFGLIVLLSVLRGRGRRSSGILSALPWILASGIGRGGGGGGGWSGGGGGGGGFSGGGGSFGGGGSSGGW